MAMQSLNTLSKFLQSYSDTLREQEEKKKKKKRFWEAIYLVVPSTEKL